MNENKFYVYTYSYPDGTPFYVGKGTGRRKNVHLCDAKAGRNSDKWCVRVIAKLLRENKTPIISIVKDNLTNDEAINLEIELIAKYGRQDIKTGILVNCTDGGDGAKNVSDEVIKKQTAKIIEWTKTSRIVNDEYKRKISETMKGRPLAEATKEKLRQRAIIFGAPFKGKKHTEESRKKMSEAQKSYAHKPHTQETKQKLSKLRMGKNNPFYGKTHKPETIARMAAATKARPGAWLGKKFSEEHLSKLRIERICPHCGKRGKGSAMNRYHMDRCKMRGSMAEVA